MAIIRLRGPFEGALSHIDRLRGEIDRVFSDAAGWQTYRESSGVFPLVNVYEGKDQFLVTAELPSVRSEDLEITVTEDSLSLKGERRIDAGRKNAGFHRKERSAGHFNRMVSLPDKVNPDKVEAKARNGVLLIALAKAENVKPRQIKVQTVD